MFTVVDRVLLHPLPFGNVDRIVLIAGAAKPPDADRLAWWGQAQSLLGLSEYNSGGMNLGGGQRPERISAAVISASLLSVIGVRPQLGRSFTDDEEVAGRNRVALLSDALWQQDFGGDVGVLGRTVRLNGIEYVVIGLMPAGFRFPGNTDAWIPRTLNNASAQLGATEQTNFPEALQSAMIGRLRAGVTLHEVNSELNALLSRLTSTYADRRSVRFGDRIAAIPLHEALVRDYRQSLVMLFAGALFVLLIVCVNTTSVLLARAVQRQNEIAIRVCLGARRARIVRQLFTESLALALVGGSLGVLFAGWGIEGIRGILPRNIPELRATQIDPRVLGFVLATSILTGILINLVPMMQVLKPNLMQSLTRGGTGFIFSVGQPVRKVLVIAEVALAVVLVGGAALMLRSLARITAVPPGFDANAFTMEIVLPEATYSITETRDSSLRTAIASGTGQGHSYRDQRIVAAGAAEGTEVRGSNVVSFHQRLERGIAVWPGVIAVGAINALPLSGQAGGYLFFDIDGKPAGQGRDLLISGEYFRAMGIPLLGGRRFNDRDSHLASKVVMINHTMAHQYWGDASPIGSLVVIEGESYSREIIGVVGDVKFGDLADPPEPQFYFPYTQPYRDSGAPLDMTYVIRSSLEPMALATRLRGEVASLDKDLPVFRMKSMKQVVASSFNPLHFRSVLLKIFAVLALILAAQGVFGVVSYSAASRTHEVGVRMSLGADRMDIMLMILSEGGRLAIAGATFGLLGILGLNTLISALLFGITATDPLTLALSASLLIGTALVASFLPALKACQLDPARALRHE